MNVLYRDTTQICEFLIFVWFYVSPVLYDMQIVQTRLPDEWRWVYFLNPMVGMIEWYRFSLLAATQLPNEWYMQTVVWMVIPYSALISIVVFIAGFFCLKRLETRAVDQM